MNVSAFARVRARGRLSVARTQDTEPKGLPRGLVEKAPARTGEAHASHLVAFIGIYPQPDGTYSQGGARHLIDQTHHDEGASDLVKGDGVQICHVKCSLAPQGLSGAGIEAPR